MSHFLSQADVPTHLQNIHRDSPTFLSFKKICIQMVKQVFNLLQKLRKINHIELSECANANPLCTFNI